MSVTIGEFCNGCSPGIKYGEITRISSELGTDSILPFLSSPFCKTHEYQIILPKGRAEFKTKSCYVRYNKQAVAYSIDGKRWDFYVEEFRLLRKNKAGKLEEIAHSEEKSGVSK